MHCPSCEAIIEKRVLELPGVTKADARVSAGTLTITCENDPPDGATLDRLFPEGNYTFALQETASSRQSGTLRVFGYAALALTLVFGLSASGLLPSVTVDTSSSLGAFFVFGLIAGISSCLALVGSLVIAMTASWTPPPPAPKMTTAMKLRPQLLFNGGRIAAYAIAGALLGMLGHSAVVSPAFSALLVAAVSILMLMTGIQMLGIPWPGMRSLSIPKHLVETLGRGLMHAGRIHPFSSGMSTVLLPCGFTLATEGVAMLSGNPIHGMGIMAAFALGTAPSLFIIGLTGAAAGASPQRYRLFTKTAGALVIIFTLFNLNNQFGIAARPGQQKAVRSAPPAAQERIIRTVYTNAADISPSRFELHAGQPVRFIVEPRDTASGCMSTIMVQGLWNHPENLVGGKPVVMEFTPDKPGNYRITCAMGVDRGVINVR